MTIAPVPVDEAVPGERPAALERRQLLALYRDMVRVRAFEEQVIDAFAEGLDPGLDAPVHRRRGRSRPARSRRCGRTTSSSRPTAATARR